MAGREGGVARREGGVASLVDKVLQRLHSNEGGAGGRKTAPVKVAKKTAKKFIKTTVKPKKTVEVNKVVKQRIKPRMAVGLKAPKARVGAGRGTAQAALLALQELRTAATWVQCGLQGCGRWRLLEEQDPAAVGRRWKCADHPDPALRRCSAPEQPWVPPSGSAAWVENRFTVGSLVWAGLAGWPSWPAMVDDDPDVGEFFWTEVAAGEWEARPTHYHVVFFDQKAVSRAWVADGRLTTFPGGLELRGPDRSNARLRRAVAAAEEAAGMELLQRRSKYCLARRLAGPWGPAWPGWGESGVATAAAQLLPPEVAEELVQRLQDGDTVDTAMGDDTFTEEVVGGEAPPRLAALWEDDSLYTQQLSQPGTTVAKGADQEPDQELEAPETRPARAVEASQAPAKDASRPRSLELGQSSAQLCRTASGSSSSELGRALLPAKSKEPARSESQELAKSQELLATSFESEGAGGEMEEGLAAALGIAELITPVKAAGRQEPSTPGQVAGLGLAAATSTPGAAPLHLSNPKAASILPSTPGAAALSSPVMSPVLQAARLDTTAGSNAFSADDSFMEM